MRNKHRIQSPCLRARLESPEAIIKAVTLTTISLGFFVLLCCVFLSKTEAKVVERRDPLIYSSKSCVSWNKQKHVKYLMRLLDAYQKRCLFNSREHGLKSNILYS